VAYINNMGGQFAPKLTDLAKDLWMWALSNNIMLSAEHIPGVPNNIAYIESRTITDRTDWKLHLSLFQQINQKSGLLEVNLFASLLSTQLPHYFSWKPDSLAEATDAFSQCWEQCRGYANPPWCLIARVLSQVKSQQAQVILVEPVWRGQPWYPVLLRMLYNFPQQLPWVSAIIQKTSNLNHMDLLSQLAIWSASGKRFQVETFQKQLRTYSSPHGGEKHPEHMNHTLGSGCADVMNGVWIPFQDPFQM